MNLRKSEILDLARRDGKVGVDALAEHFNVTLQTIRRDLTDLANSGQLLRVHGGAVLPSGTTNIAYQERRALQSEAKQKIARACAAAIPDNCTLFLNIGTTTEAVANELLHHRDLIVITNNMNVATILSANPAAKVILTGGDVRATDGGLLGHLTNEAIRRYKVDIAVIGCSAIDGDGDLLDFDGTEVSASQTIIAQSRSVFVVADTAKFDRSAPARIAPLSVAHALFTDAPIPPGLAKACADWGVTIEIGD